MSSNCFLIIHRLLGQRRGTVAVCLVVCLVVCLIMAGALPAPARAQSTRPVTVTGLTFDSLRGVPLANAFVTIAERSRSTTSDAKGRFVFDSIPPGAYTFAMQHAAFDSLGLSGATTRAVISNGKDVVTLAVPSFATIWRTVCGSLPVPVKDTGLVFGSIRDARRGQPVPEASVAVTWLDLVNVGTKEISDIRQRRWKNEAQADKRGDFAVCGVPVSTQLRLRASFLTNTTGLLDLLSSPDRVRRHDLVVPGILVADSAQRGAIAGQVTDDNGRPVAGVRVILDEITEVRTDADGRFVIRSAPTGTRLLDLAAVGMTPVSTVVDVMVGETAVVTASLRTVSNLEAMRVTATSNIGRLAAQFQERRKQGFGSYLDSTAMASRGTMAAAFYGVPGVTVERAQGTSNARRFRLYLPSTGTGPCLATLYFDGVFQQDQAVLEELFPADIAAIEVYQQRLTVPTEFMNRDVKCGVVAVWTKRAFR